jgi:hypothetical protein
MPPLLAKDETLSMSAPSRDQVFISYSHRDKKWLDRLLVFLKPFQRQGLQVWADPYIQMGERWGRAIEGALERACIGVLLVSPDFLASDFIYEQELPSLKRAADRGHLVLICVPVAASAYQFSDLDAYQWPCDPEKPLDKLSPSKRNQVLVKISQAIHEAALRYAPPPEPKAAAIRTAVADLVAGEGLGSLHGVPPQRPHYISRPEELARLKQRLLGSTAPALGITGTTQSVGVHGMGGIGKTVLAIALVNDEEVRRHFTDGIYWMTFGQNAALETLQAELLRTLTGRLDAMSSVEQGRARVAEVLTEKACLLVLDDVWKAEDGRAFAALGPRGRLLLTTRDAALLTALGAKEASLEVMQPQAALALLADWSGQPRASLPPEAERLAEACGHLPLALALAGAQVRDGRAWADLLHALHDGKLEFLDHPYGSVFGSMRMSVNALLADTARRYHELAVFPEDVPIPEATVAHLWAHTGGLKAYQTRALLVELQRKNLLQLYEGALGFHDLQQDYLRIAVNDLLALHGALLAAYEKELPDGPAPAAGPAYLRMSPVSGGTWPTTWGRLAGMRSCAPCASPFPGCRPSSASLTSTRSSPIMAATRATTHLSGCATRCGSPPTSSSGTRRNWQASFTGGWATAGRPGYRNCSVLPPAARAARGSGRCGGRSLRPGAPCCVPSRATREG